MSRLLDELARPGAYPHATDGVRVIQTHISVVFLAGPYAYKVKKPVNPGFLDYGTLERRRWFCHEEVRLNRRLAPSVYHGVVPVVAGPDGLRVLDVLLSHPDDRNGASSEGSPKERVQNPVEFAVRMTRLPDHRTLKALLAEGTSVEALLDRLAHLLVTFHRHAERSPAIAEFGNFDTVASNAQENFAALAAAEDATVGPRVLRRLRELSDATLLRLRPMIERRARAGLPCDTHGDLRLEHVYALDDAGEERLLVVDCIEFSERLRYADPVADIAFLVMELEFEGRGDLGRAFASRYLEEAGDPEGAELLPWYVTYRDIVRGKVRTLQAQDPGIEPAERDHAARRAVRHFLCALGRLAPAHERPCLVLVAGLPGTGKSVLARGLKETGGFEWIDTDHVRKRLAAADGTRLSSGEVPFEQGIYGKEWTERTYAECLNEAMTLLFDGARVVVDGSFRAEHHRALFLDAARARGVPVLILHCVTDRRIVRRRLEARRGDVSDADWRIFEEAERRWDPPGAEVASVMRRVETEAPREEVLRSAQGVLRREGLL